MNRNQLLAFTTAYETKKLVLTAEKMFISQSAVSQQIRKLEEELNAELFVHKKGQILPSEFGHLFYPYARDALAAISRGEEAIRRRKLEDNQLVVYAYSYNGESVISQAAQAFREAYPRIHLEMRRAAPPSGVHIAENALYFVNEDWVSGRDLHYCPMYRAHYLCVMRPEDIPAGRDCLRAEDLSGMVNYLPPGRNGKRSPLFDEIIRKAPKENIRISPDFATSLLNISISGGVCVCPDYLFFSRQLTAIPYQPEQSIGVGFAYAGAPSENMKEFLAFMKKRLSGRETPSGFS